MIIIKLCRLFSVVIVIWVIYANQVLAEQVVTFVGDPWPPYVEGNDSC